MEGEEIFFYVPRDEWVEIDDSLPKDNPESGYVQQYGLLVRWFNQTKVVEVDGNVISYMDLVALVINYTTEKMEYINPLNIDIKKSNLQNGRIKD